MRSLRNSSGSLALNKSFQRWGYILSFPAFAVIVFMFVIPMFQNIYISLFESDGMTVMNFIGMENYINMFKDSNFIRSVVNSLLWVVFTIVFSVGVGLLIAVFLNGIKGENIFKSIFFVPLTISFVSVGAIWWYMYSKEYGILNEILNLLGFKTKIDWLYKVPLNNISLLIAYSWQQLGIQLVMFLMGLMSIPSEQIEASRIDGCGRWKTVIHVTFPMLKPITTVVVGMAIVNSFKAFDLIYIMTRGGPVRTSETLAVNMFVESFQRNHQGFGAAIGVFLTLLVLPLTSLYVQATTSVDHVDNK
jgi:multiple sugar transport system permease protein